MKKIISLLVCVMFLLGCGSYYKVTDPASSKIYYTKDIDRMRNGAIKFKDEITKSEVILQSSEVKKIDSKEFKEDTKPPQSTEK